jgi:hypothetical protein
MGVIFLSVGLPQDLILRGDSERPEVRQNRRRVIGVIFLSVGLPPEPYFEDQGDLWRGQRSGKAEIEQ